MILYYFIILSWSEDFEESIDLKIYRHLKKLICYYKIRLLILAGNRDVIRIVDRKLVVEWLTKTLRMSKKHH
jgi:hypothetical protein